MFVDNPWPVTMSSAGALVIDRASAARRAPGPGRPRPRRPPGSRSRSSTGCQPRTGSTPHRRPRRARPRGRCRPPRRSRRCPPTASETLPCELPPWLQVTLQPSSATARAGTSAHGACCSTSATRSASVTSFFASASAIACAVDGVERLALEVVAELLQLALQAAPARELADRQPRARQPDRLRGHDLVGQRVLEHAVLVDARLVGEGVAADDGLVGLDGEAGEVARRGGWRR